MSITSLADLKKVNQEAKDLQAARDAARKEYEERPKVVWAKFEKDRKYEVRFITDFPVEGGVTNSGAPPVEFHTEYSVSKGDFGAKDYAQMRFIDDDGTSLLAKLAEETSSREYKVKNLAYFIMVIKDYEGEDFQSVVWTRNINQPFIDELIEIYDEEGTLSDRVYYLTKRGEKTTTTFSIKEAKTSWDVPEDLKIWNVSDAISNIPFDRQYNLIKAIIPSDHIETAERIAGIDSDAGVANMAKDDEEAFQWD